MDLPESSLYEGIAIDLVFRDQRPEFGDLFTVCGYANPAFPPKTRMFEALADLGFVLVDDFFGIRADTEEGEDVLIWLIPLVNGDEAFHDPGPFDGMRLSFNPLRHPSHRSRTFPEVVERMVTSLPVEVHDGARGEVVAAAEVKGRILSDIAKITAYWAAKGIVCGSPKALRIE